jgi:hypothetical protein
VVLDSDGIVDVIDEGYRGDGALKVAGFGTLQVQAEFRTTPAEYRATLKAGGHTRRVSIAAKLAETVEFAVNDAVRYGGASKGRK